MEKFVKLSHTFAHFLAREVPMQYFAASTALKDVVATTSPSNIDIQSKITTIESVLRSIMASKVVQTQPIQVQERHNDDDKNSARRSAIYTLQEQLRTLRFQQSVLVDLIQDAEQTLDSCIYDSRRRT